MSEGIGVKGVKAVVLGGDVEHIMDALGYGQGRNVERLGVHLAVHGDRRQFAERRLLHICRGQGGLLQILTGAGVVVMPSEDGLSV